MKIPHSDGSETNTEKLNDLSAELFERAAEFSEFCHKYKIPIYCKFIDKPRELASGFSHFHSDDNFGLVISSMIEDLESMTNGQIKVIYNDENENGGDNESWKE